MEMESLQSRFAQLLNYGPQFFPAPTKAYRTPFHVRRGNFHKWLGKKSGSPITKADIAKGKASGDPRVVIISTFAANAKKWH